MRKRQQGFTLIELLVVIVIMLGLMAVIAGDISKMFQGNDIDQAKRVVLNAFAKARSKAVALEQYVCIYVAYRTLEEQPEAKLWVVVGAGVDKDTLLSSPLKGFSVDEFDYDNLNSGSVSMDDSVLPVAYTLPMSVYIHGIQTSNTGDSKFGEYIRWYALFYPDGSCKMLRPDGDGDDAPTSGTLAAWNVVNDYLPEFYGYDKVANAGVATSDTVILVEKTTQLDFETDPVVNHDLKIYNQFEEKYFILQRGPGKLVLSSVSD
jgi:prepilin-type N-terminal cleavage/methylation domain-containing protein